jgi:hypothetical protein
MRAASWTGAAIILAAFAAWVLIPPFPLPAKVVNDTFATLIEELGRAEAVAACSVPPCIPLTKG